MALIEITRRLYNGFPAWPGDVAFRREIVEEQVGEHRCRTSSLALGAHCGTHLDAPAHLQSEGAAAATVDEVDLRVLIGPARVVDARGCSTIDSSAIRALPDCPSRVLFRTDTSDRAYAMQGYVALTAEAAESLVSRACLLVGIDGPSVDPLDSLDLPAHKILLEAGILILEGLDLGRAAPGDYELICLPLLLEGGEAAPARAVLRILDDVSKTLKCPT